MRLASLISSLLICSGLAGCMTPQVYQLEPVPVSGHAQLTVKDHRPEIEKSTEILSFVIKNEAYGIQRLGDAATVPDRMRFLMDMLGSAAGDKVGSKPVLVKSLTIHKNTQAQMRGSNLGKQGALTKLVFDSLETRAAKRQPGGYELSENPDQQNAAVIDLLVAIEGNEYRPRVVRPAPGTAVQFNADSPIWEKTVDAGMRQAVMQLASEINRH